VVVVVVVVVGSRGKEKCEPQLQSLMQIQSPPPLSLPPPSPLPSLLRSSLY